MKSYDYEAVTFDGSVYCIGCLPKPVAPAICRRCKAEAVTRANDPEWFDGIYCPNESCPNYERGLDEKESLTSADGVFPIFADSEWDTAPVCDACGCVHDYVTVLESEES